MATQVAQRNRRGSSLLLVSIIVIAAMVTFATYAAGSNSNTLTITPPSTTSGAKVDVSSVASTFSAVQGKAKKTRGVVLSKLTFGTPDDSNDVVIEFMWTDPDQATGVLLNPNAFLETRVYFLDTDQQAATGGGYSGSCNSTTQRTFEDSGNQYVCPDPDEGHNFKALSISSTVAYFIPTIDGQSVLYILADITVPGGAPAGQQSSLTELTFIIGIS